MKTTLIIDDIVFQEAKKESKNTGFDIGVIISQWALDGLKLAQSKKMRSEFIPVDLGKMNCDLSSRKEWHF